MSFESPPRFSAARAGRSFSPARRSGRRPPCRSRGCRARPASPPPWSKARRARAGPAYSRSR
ncbi:MAG: hypothetical protein GC185_02615 [Alphaproteobacteria bacterium]|nr:hypothetical protein [Alphaproteobacteria bacterium]